MPRGDLFDRRFRNEACRHGSRLSFESRCANGVYYYECESKTQTRREADDSQEALTIRNKRMSASVAEHFRDDSIAKGGRGKWLERIGILRCPHSNNGQSRKGVHRSFL